MKLIKNFKEYLFFLFLFIILLIILYFSPSDLILGDFSKLVYIHGSLIWVSLLYFILVSIISIFNIFSNNQLKNYLIIIEELAIIFWISSTLLGLTSAYLSWGGILWNEPRIIMSLIIAIVSLTIYFILITLKNNKINNTLSLSQLLIILILLQTSQNIFHPVNSILQSNFSIKLSFLLQVILLLIISFSIIRVRIKNIFNFNIYQNNN